MTAAATYPVETIAKLLLLTPRRVQQLTKAGHLPKADRGRYELVAVVQAYVRYLRDRAVNGDAGEDDIGTHKARLIKARARAAEIEADALDGTRLHRADVDRAWQAITANLRAAMLGFPSKHAPIIYGAPSIREVHARLTAGVHDVLDHLSRQPVYDETERATPDREGDEGDAGDPGAAAEVDGERMGGPGADAIAGGERGAGTVDDQPGGIPARNNGRRVRSRHRNGGGDEVGAGRLDGDPE